MLDTTYEIRMARKNLNEAIFEIYTAYQAANKEGPELVAGPWCARCEALTNCPAAGGAIDKIAQNANLEAIRTPGKIPTVKVIGEHLSSEIAKWSRGRFLGYVELLPFLQPLVDAVKKRLKAELVGGVTHSKYRLTTKRNNRKGSVRELRRALGDLFSAGEIDDLCSPKFGDIVKALKARGYSEEWIDKKLEPFYQGKRDQVARR